MQKLSQGKAWVACLFYFILVFTAPVNAARIMHLQVEGGIGPATADFLIRHIEHAQDYDLILITLNTPGGLDKSTRMIVQAILSAPIPVITYVSPNGARAASAGTILLYASTIAAMAPSTHLGAASPVSIMSGDLGKDEKDKQASTMDKKVTNDALAYLRSLAQLRNRNVEFSEKAITEAATLTAPEALTAGVINLIAKDVDDLLVQINGMTVMQNGKAIKINTSQNQIVNVAPDWRMQLLLIIADPTVAYLILLLGVYGLFFEFVSPGYIVPGVIGGIAILIALYALQLLPINYAGLALIFLGLAFIVAEAFTPSFGALGIGGTVAFVFGSIFLMDTEQEGFQVARSAILAMGIVNLALFLTIVSMAVQARKREPVNGLAHLIGETGVVLNEGSQGAQAKVRGEIWAIHAQEPLSAGDLIEVIRVNGLMLEVRVVKT